MLVSFSPFQIQQRLFSPDSSAVSSELSVLLYHPVAGNDDADAVQPVGVSHGPLRVPGANAVRQLFV